jgi:pimeloyl-ACP methyl ester carboxylesterase
MGDTHEVRLPDGRVMAYADHGDPAGPVVLTCVGTPDSRLVDRRLVALVEQLGIRILVPDRPGVGRSDPLPGRTLADWPADAAALLDALGVDRCPVTGGSGGGPYAVACGVLLADRVTAVALVAPAAPRTAPAHGFVPLAEAALRERGETFARLIRDDPEGVFAFIAPDESEPDRQAHAALGPDEKEQVFASLREAFRQGADAYVQEHLICASDWADLLPRLTRPTRIWQGTDDNNVPAESTRWLAERIPGAELTLLPGAGHSLTDETLPDVYHWLLTTAPARPTNPRPGEPS